ncbi:DUF3164 family protein [Variovorax boronicumulans]
MTDQTIPAGYWPDAKGALFHVSKIKPIDKDRTAVVTELCEAAKTLSAQIAGFKLTAAQAFEDFIGRSADQYNVVLRGSKGKGNVTLATFSGNYKIIRQVSDTLVFDERLQVAESLIGECIQDWSKGSKAEIKALVNSAFQVDKAGQISTSRVLGLRNIAIDDPRWLQAMQAINDSMRVASSKSYTRYYERDERSGEYLPIVLDVAAV